MLEWIKNFIKNTKNNIWDLNLINTTKTKVKNILTLWWSALVASWICATDVNSIEIIDTKSKKKIQKEKIINKKLKHKPFSVWEKIIVSPNKFRDKNSKLNLRKSDNLKSDIISKIPQWSTLTVIDNSINNFIKIQTTEWLSWYISKNYVIKSEDVFVEIDWERFYMYWERNIHNSTNVKTKQQIKKKTKIQETKDEKTISHKKNETNVNFTKFESKIKLLTEKIENSKDTDLKVLYKEIADFIWYKEIVKQDWSKKYRVIKWSFIDIIYTQINNQSKKWNFSSNSPELVRIEKVYNLLNTSINKKLREDDINWKEITQSKDYFTVNAFVSIQNNSKKVLMNKRISDMLWVTKCIEFEKNVDAYTFSKIIWRMENYVKSNIKKWIPADDSINVIKTSKLTKLANSILRNTNNAPVTIHNQS